MMKFFVLRAVPVVSLLAPFFAVTAHAVPVTVTVSGSGPCDTLVALPTGIHELGLGSDFEPGERIESGFTFPGARVCDAAADDALIPNVEVTIVNRTGVRWREVHYVSDPESSMTNFDGLINGEEAFRIDTIGANTPLIFESAGDNGLFEPGETWVFVIQDYTDAFARSPALFLSVGLVGSESGSATIPDSSTGSIIALQVDPLPAPATALLVVIGGASVALGRHAVRWRRRHARAGASTESLTPRIPA